MKIHRISFSACKPIVSHTPRPTNLPRGAGKKQTDNIVSGIVCNSAAAAAATAASGISYAAVNGSIEAVATADASGSSYSIT